MNAFWHGRCRAHRSSTTITMGTSILRICYHRSASLPLSCAGQDLTANFLAITIKQAFSHFTWEESKRKLLVCDIQGVRFFSFDISNLARSFISRVLTAMPMHSSPHDHLWQVDDCYTDPQIHSVDGEGFGTGNMGLKGIKKFFSTHKCNAVCQLLQLDSLDPFGAR